MLRLIVNADDFGINHDVNQAVCECFSRRFISSTTLMVNMPYADEAVELAKQKGFEERVGLHLNLTSGMPLTDGIKEYRCFCHKDGRFNAAFQKNTSMRLHLGKEETAVMYQEIEAQMRKYIGYGLPDHHLDSHHHVHTDRSVYRALVPLIRKYDMKSVRLSRNLYKNIPYLKAVYKKSYNRNLKKLGVMTTDYFGSYRDFSENRDKILDNTLTEIMLHPMYSKEGVLCDTREPMQNEHDHLISLKTVFEFY